MHRRIEAHLANHVLETLKVDFAGCELSAAEQLEYIKNFSPVKQFVNLDTQLKWQRLIDEIFEKPDVKDLLDRFTKGGKEYLEGYPLKGARWLYDRLLRAKDGIAEKKIEEVGGEEEDEEEEEEDSDETFESDLRGRRNVTRQYINVAASYNGSIQVGWNVHVATDVAVTGGNTKPVTLTLAIYPLYGHPKYISGTSKSRKKNRAQGFQLIIYFGHEDLKECYQKKVLKNVRPSFNVYLDSYLQLDRKSPTYNSDVLAIRYELNELIAVQMLESDEMSLAVLKFVNTDHEIISPQDNDVCLMSDTNTPGTEAYFRGITEALKDESVLSADGRTQLLGGIVDSAKGRFLMKIREHWVQLDKPQARQFTFHKLHWVSQKNENRIKNQQLAALAAERLPVGETHIRGNVIVNPMEQDGKDDIITAINKEIFDDDGNVKEGLSSYIGDSTMDGEGGIKYDEDLLFIVKRHKLVKPNGSGLSRKNLAFDESEVDDERILLVKRNKLAAVLGGHAGLAAEKHGIKHIMNMNGLLHLNYGNYGKPGNEKMWHIIYHTLLPNLRHLLREKKLFLFVGGPAAQSTKREINAKLRSNEQSWLDFDPRIKHTRISTKTGKVKFFYTVPHT